MVASTLGREVTLAQLRQMSDSTGRGATLEQLLQVSAQLNLLARPVRLPLAEIKRLVVPAILHWRMNHFVVLICVRRRRALIHDPALGRQWVSMAEVDESFTGIALEIRRGPDFAPGLRRSSSGVLQLVRGVGNIRRYLAIVLLLIFAGQLLSLAPAVVTQLLIDEVILGQAGLWLASALAGLSVVLLSSVLIDALRRWITLYAGASLALDTTCNLVAHLLRLPIAFVCERHLGDIMSKLDSLTPLRKAITEQSIDGIANIVMLLVTLIVMTLYDTRLTVVSIIGLLVSLIVLASMLPKVQQLNNRLLVQRAIENSSLLESFRAFETVKGLGLTEVRGTHWQNRFFASTDTAFRLGKFDIARNSLLATVAGAEQVAFLAIGIGGAMEQEVSVGVLFAFMSLRGRFASAATRLVDGFQFFALLRIHADRLTDLASGEAEKPAPKGALSRKIDGAVEIRNLNFSFSASKPLIRDFNCSIPSDTHAVITGPSGCGKTTLLKIVSGQLRAGSGDVLVDGIEIALWDRAAYTRQTGIVQQHEHLFQGTIAENIAGFSPCPDLSRVKNAAMAASVWDDIREMPMQTETLLGDTGLSLSGGQVQRLAIARALYRRPRILFLDEATSHLDTDTESKVLANICALRITVISIAHRPGAIAQAGQIIALGGPRVAS